MEKKKKRTQKDYILTHGPRNKNKVWSWSQKLEYKENQKKKNPNPFLCRTLTENQQVQYWEGGTDQRESHRLLKAYITENVTSPTHVIVYVFWRHVIITHVQRQVEFA